MRISQKKSRRHLLAAGAAVLLGVAGSAAAASNTVPRTSAGDGHAAIARYTVVAGSTLYTLNGNNPQAIDEVRFQLSPAPPASATVRAQLSTGTTWYPCTLSGATATCTTTAPVQGLALSGTTAINQLRIAVAD